MFKQLKKQTNLYLSILIVFAIFTLVNFWAYSFFWRFDLTESKDYSISQTSKDAVKDLNDIVNVDVYFSNNLPNTYVATKQGVADFLSEYSNYSHGKFVVKWISPEDSDESRQKMMMMGIPELQFNVMEKDKYQVTRGYIGVAFRYKGKTEVIPTIENLNNFEYEVTLALKKLTSAQIPSIGYLGKKDDKSSANALKKLNEVYNVQTINPEDKMTIPEDVKTLIINDLYTFTDNQLKTIDSFLSKTEHNLIVFSDSVTVEQNLQAQTNKNDLNKILKEHGVEIKSNLIADISSAMTTFSQGFVSFSVNYPYWPKIVKDGLSSEKAAVSKISNIVFPWTSSIAINKDKIQNNNKIITLIKSTPNALEQKEPFNLSPQASLDFDKNKGNSHALAVALFGTFNSIYNKDTKNTNGRLIVVGDTDFFKDNFSQSNDNLTLFQNLVDMASLDEDLINIRSKTITERPLKEVSDQLRQTIKYFNVFGVTLIVVSFGLVRYYLRRKKQVNY